MTAAFARWLGGGLGWAMGGPIGALIGFAIGSVLDERSGSVESQFGRGPSDSSRTTTEGVGDFGLALLVLTAVVMKADGMVLKSELDYVKDVLKKSFGLEKARQLTLMLREVINKDIDPQGVCRQIADNMNVAGRRELLHLLFGIALADGTMGAAELDCLKELARLLRISQSDFDSIRAMYGQTTEDAYTVLEVSPSATDEELKKAYRRMATKHHPDKVAHLGPEAQKAANEKFQQLSQAWDQIQRARGSSI